MREEEKPLWAVVTSIVLFALFLMATGYIIADYLYS